MKNMRKLISALLVAVFLCACVAVAEETTPSPVKPAATVSQIVITTEVETEVPFVVEVVETEQWSEAAVAEFEKITEELAAPEAVPADIFTEEEIAEVTELLPEEFDVNTLTVAEFIPMNIDNYVPEIGDAAIHLELPGEYTEEDVLVAMFKPFNGDESSWIALEAKVVVAEEETAEEETAEEETAEEEAAEEEAATEDDAEAEVTSNIEVLFTQEVLEMVTANEGALLILRGNAE